jgi:hypothetical protein
MPTMLKLFAPFAVGAQFQPGLLVRLSEFRKNRKNTKS